MARKTKRLNRLVGNLLDMTRIDRHAESGGGALRRSRGNSATLERLQGRLANRPVIVDAPPVLAPMDFVLMVQVLGNLLDNALKYSADDTPIEVTVRSTGGALEMTTRSPITALACRQKTWSESSTSSTASIAQGK